MYYIALQMLFGNRAKYLTMILGVTFAAQMMTQQPAIFIGLLTRTYSVVKDVPEPDIWVMDPGVKFVEKSKPIRDIELLKVRGIKGVLWAVPMYKGATSVKLPDGTFTSVDLTGLDDATLIGAPYRIPTNMLNNFKRPNAVFVDINAANTRLRVNIGDNQSRALSIGDTLEINDKRAIVVGMVKTTRNFIIEPQMFTTYSNAIHYTPQDRKSLGYILVKAKHGINHDALAEKIINITKLEAQTTEQFKQHNLDYWLHNTGIPINFGITVLLGFIVGAAIAGQTFYGFVLDNLKHYAVLKAMGATNNMLIRIVLTQALTVGFIGYGIGVGITALFGLYFQDEVLAFRMPPFLLLFSAAGVLIIISFAALLGIRRVTSVDPASVFRE
ncbi:MAG: FtsX-like permease family protein [Rickettsiaceae bacterium]|nr:FtsX-like permease family protein [Rickettsiaceae bacterium]